LLKVAIEEAPRVRSLRPDVPEALDDLVARMLAKAPADRPQDGAAVAAEILRLEGAVSERHRSLPPSSGFTTTEQRLLCVLVARAAGEAEGIEDPDSIDDTESNELELSAV